MNVCKWPQAIIFYMYMERALIPGVFHAHRACFMQLDMKERRIEGWYSKHSILICLKSWVNILTGAWCPHRNHCSVQLKSMSIYISMLTFKCNVHVTHVYFVLSYCTKTEWKNYQNHTALRRGCQIVLSCAGFSMWYHIGKHKWAIMHLGQVIVHSGPKPRVELLVVTRSCHYCVHEVT